MADHDDPKAWSDAARGLETHRTGVLIRLAVIILAVLYVAKQIASNDRGSPGFFTLVLGAGELFGTLLAAAGASRFARRTPDGSAGPAGIATLCMVGIMIAEVWALWVVWRVLEFTEAASHADSMWNMPSIGDLMEQAERLRYVQLGASVAALIAVLSMLTGLRSVGRALRRDDLVDRAGGMATATVMLALAYIGLQWWIAKGHQTDGMVVALAMLALFGLVVLLGYLGVLRTARDAMHGGPPAIPTATVHSEG